MEKAAIAYVSLSDEQINLLKPIFDMCYSAACINRSFFVLVREKAFTETQFRTHILRVLKRLNINAPRNKRNWLQTLSEREARDIISAPVEADSRIIVLARRH